MESSAKTSDWIISSARIVQAGVIGGLLSVPVFEWIFAPDNGLFIVHGLLWLVVPGLISSFLIRKAFPDRALWGAVIIGVFVLAIYASVSFFDWPPPRH